MRRRTLDIVSSIAAIVLAFLLATVGFVLNRDANFAEKNTGGQLASQGMTFKAVDGLSSEELAFSRARTGCLETFAGQAVTTGKQAECYANEYIGAHLSYLPTRLGLTTVAWADGMNYVKLGSEQGRLRTEIATAQKSGDPALPQLTQQLADLTTVRTKMFEGTMLRNALLTVYGFSVLGDRAALGAQVAFIGALLLALLAAAGFIHARRTPPGKMVAHEPARHEADKRFANV
jgi:hypothetical protein